MALVGSVEAGADAEGGDVGVPLADDVEADLNLAFCEGIGRYECA